MRGRKVPEAPTWNIKMGAGTFKVSSVTLTREIMQDALTAARADFVATENALELLRNPPRLPEPTPFERGALARFQDGRRK